MRVLHVVESMRRGGAESVVVEHVRRADPGVESLVVALNLAGPAFDAAIAAGARTWHLGKGSARVAGLARLVSILRRERVEVVNGHNATGGLYGTLAGMIAGTPVRIRTEHTLHYRGRHSAVYPALEPVLTALTDRVVCVSEAVRASHADRLRTLAARFVTVPNGISPAPPGPGRDATRGSLGLAADAIAFLTIGSLTPQKAQHMLLAGFAAVAASEPRARLVVAGDGPRLAELEARARALGIGDRVAWLGLRTDASDLLDACDVFVLSSEREGMPMSVLEAMRAGRPVVSTRVGGTPEVVVEGVTGLLCPVGDSESLGVAMRALAADARLREAFGLAGRARWAECFTADRMVRATEAVYREALARRGRGSAADTRRTA